MKNNFTWYKRESAIYDSAKYCIQLLDRTCVVDLVGVINLTLQGIQNIQTNNLFLLLVANYNEKIYILTDFIYFDIINFVCTVNRHILPVIWKRFSLPFFLFSSFLF